MKKSDIQNIAKKLFNTEKLVIATLLPKPANAESLKYNLQIMFPEQLGSDALFAHIQ